MMISGMHRNRPSINQAPVLLWSRTWRPHAGPSINPGVVGSGEAPGFPQGLLNHQGVGAQAEDISTEAICQHV